MTTFLTFLFLSFIKSETLLIEQRGRAMKSRGFVEWNGSFYIPLTQSQITIVDPEDAPWLGQWNWYAVIDQCGNWRVRRQQRHGKLRRWVSMARIIMQTPPNLTVDHIRGDTLDHRKQWLRNCTHQQNLLNQKPSRGRIYKGVYFVSHNKTNPWQAKIQVFGKRLYLGSFPTAKLAAATYNEAALEYHGEFARLNVIDDD